jgi:hypothetical protein
VLTITHTHTHTHDAQHARATWLCFFFSALAFLCVALYSASFHLKYLPRVFSLFLPPAVLPLLCTQPHIARRPPAGHSPQPPQRHPQHSISKRRLSTEAVSIPDAIVSMSALTLDILFAFPKSLSYFPFPVSLLELECIKYIQTGARARAKITWKGKEGTSFTLSQSICSVYVVLVLAARSTALAYIHCTPSSHPLSLTHSSHLTRCLTHAILQLRTALSSNRGRASCSCPRFVCHLCAHHWRAREAGDT